MQPAKNWSVVPLPAPVNHLVVNMTAKLIMTTNLMSLIMMMVKMVNKMSRMTIAVLVVAVKLKLSCLV